MSIPARPRRPEPRHSGSRLSPEFTLAAACCRPPGADRDAVTRAAADGVDWIRFEAVLARHRVEGLSWAALNAAGVSLPEATAGRLAKVAGEIAIGGLRLAAETARLQGALDQAGIANLALKGAALEKLAWGRIGVKRAWDIDLLILQSDAAAARRILEDAGYDLGDPPDASAATFAAWVELAKESAFVHRESGLVAELHWRLVDGAGLLADISARWPAQTVVISPALGLRTLEPEALFAYLCVHGASHAWSRLKWLADLGALAAARDEEALARLYRRAGELGAGHCPAAALRLCERLLGLALPGAVSRDIRRDRKAGWLAALAMNAMNAGGRPARENREMAERPLFGDLVLLSQFLFADGWRFRRAEWRRQAIGVDDRMRLRLGGPLAVLYGPVRAPLWLWRRLRRAFATDPRR
jgi:hypothetical protein